MSIENRDYKGELAACILGFSVGLPWLFSYSYSLGYDLPLWIYNGWFIKNTLLEGIWPNWSFLSASGQPFFKISGLSDGVLLALLMSLFGIFTAVQVIMCLLYVVAAVGFYRLTFIIRPWRPGALIASGAYILSWFMSFTVNFQAYLSNFFVYALAPFFVYYFLQLINPGRIRCALWAALILALAILSNPQVAIKIVLVALVVTVPFLGQKNVRYFFGIAFLTGIIALSLTAFDVVSALRLRGEVISANARINGYISPFSLIAIPAYAFSLIWEFIGGVRWPAISLTELLYSKYPGGIVLLLSILALRSTTTFLFVRWMWFAVIVSYAVFFCIMPVMPATPWLGTSHNLLIFPTFFLALLTGVGSGSLFEMKVLDRRRSSAVLITVITIGCLELGTLFLGVRIWGAQNSRPEELPQAKLWSELVRHIEREPLSPRFMSLYPNLSKNLFPVITGFPTANVIELRQRSPEYQSYLDLIKRCSREEDCPQKISNLLAQINVGYIDVPAMASTYNGPGKEPKSHKNYLDVLRRVYEDDPHLKRVLARTVPGNDGEILATSTNWTPWKSSLFSLKRGELTAQVIYKNNLRFPARVTEGAIALVGVGIEPEKEFEQIVLFPEYEPGRFVFILTQSLDRIDEGMRNVLLGYVNNRDDASSVSMKKMDQEDIRDLYRSPTKSYSSIGAYEQVGDKLTINFDKPVSKERFILISKQYFRDWIAQDEQGNYLPLFKIGGGLTGTYVQAGTNSITLSYCVPPPERIARWFSFFSCICLVTGLLGLNSKVRSYLQTLFNLGRAYV